MKLAILRPQALRDRQIEVRYYRKKAGSKVALRLVNATNAALDRMHDDQLDVVRLLGDRQDVAAILGAEFDDD